MRLLHIMSGVVGVTVSTSLGSLAQSVGSQDAERVAIIATLFFTCYGGFAAIRTFRHWFQSRQSRAQGGG